MWAGVAAACRLIPHVNGQHHNLAAQLFCLLRQLLRCNPTCLVRGWACIVPLCPVGWHADCWVCVGPGPQARMQCSSAPLRLGWWARLLSDGRSSALRGDYWCGSYLRLSCLAPAVRAGGRWRHGARRPMLC